MKPQLTITMLLLCLTSLTAQVKFKVKLQSDNQTYQVLVRPDADITTNIVSSVQVTLKVPTGGFAVGSLSNHAGMWSHAGTAVAPAESPDYDYIFFSLQSVTTDITFAEGVEVPIFSFANTGSCTGALELYENGSDPFAVPNSLGIDPNNGMVMLTGNVYTGNYGSFPADCTPSSNCGIEIFDIVLTAPSACGVADGSIEIIATNSNGLPLQYSINGGINYQADSIFTGLASGYAQEIIVRDLIASCIVEPGTFELDGPLAAIVNGVEMIAPDCDQSNGSFIIDATPENGGILNYGVGNPPTYQASDTISGLPAGFHDLWVIDVTNNCQNFIGSYQLDDCPQVPCTATYELERLATGEYQISMIPNETYTIPFNTTATAQYTVKVPTGGFVTSNIVSLVPNVSFALAGVTAAPPEDPAHDYISFMLNSPGTTNLPYTADVKVPLFTFENSGTCQGGTVFLMDNDTDPFFPPNSQNANVGQQLTVLGYGGPDAPLCILNQPADDCDNDPCSSLNPGFGAPLACENQTINFTDSTTSTETITSWNWDFGDGSAPSQDQSPSHTYSTSGNFEVSLTVTTESGCEATFSEFVTVFTPPAAPSVTEYTDCGTGVQLVVPDADSILWTPAAGLDDATISNPYATPALSTVYTVTLTSADGCQTVSDVSVEVETKPVFKDVVVTAQSECGVQDASILVSAQGTDQLEYSLDNVNWQTDSLFTAVPAGDYTMYIRNVTGNCEVAYVGNPVTVTDLPEPSIDSILTTDPSGCADDGAISIAASGGDGSLQYSIPGLAGPQASADFPGLTEGSYTVEVSNSDGTCLQSQQATLTNLGSPPTIVNPIADLDICVDNTATVSIETSATLSGFDITGSGAYSNASISGNTLTFDINPVLGDNSYAVSLTADNGCIATDDFIATGIASPVAAVSSSPTLCVDGEITLNSTGTASANASYSWTLDGGTVQFANNDSTTLVVSYADMGVKDVCLIVEDGGCQVTECIALDISDFDPGLTSVASDPSCDGNDGSIELSLTGAGNYTFQWTGPGINDPILQNQSGLPGGTYMVTITDADSGCETTEAYQLSAPVGMSISADGTDASDCAGAGSDGTITVDILGGTGTFIYDLFESGNMDTSISQITSNDKQAVFTNLDAGAYEVVVTDANGCSDQTTVAIQSVAATYTVSLTTQEAGCGLMDGVATAEITGQGTYTFDFYKNNIPQATGMAVNGNTLTLTNLAPATYTLIIYDDTGCLTPETFNITSQDANFGITESVSNPSCGGSDGSIELMNLPQGAIITWTDVNQMVIGNSNPLSGLDAGIYIANVIDANGCSDALTYQLDASDGAEVTITNLQNASCGSEDGSITFEVTGGNDFEYHIVGTAIEGFGSPGDAINVPNLGDGVYAVEITDLINSDCQSFELFEITGGLSASSLLVINTPPSACGVSDGDICVTFLDGGGPYTIDSDFGTPPAGQVTGTGCITGLYDGTVVVTVTNVANGCSTDIPVALPEVFEPALTMDSVLISGTACPDDFGSVMSVHGSVYEIYDGNNSKVGETPWLAARPGTYTVRYKVGDCQADLDIVVQGPEDWSIVIAETDACGNDGAVALDVVGANGGYSYLWSNGEITSSIENLAAGNYTVTISDSEGCDTVLTAVVGVACSNDPCDDIFYNDTITIALQGDRTKICLPTEYPDISIFDLGLDGAAYSDDLEPCLDNTNFYGYGMLLNLGSPPYRMDEWRYRGIVADAFMFSTIEELVDHMNNLDPTGNWLNDAMESSISGGASGSVYGNLIITHIASNTTLNLQVNTISVAHPGIFVSNNPVHVLIATDPLNSDCADTLYINLVDPPGYSDSLTVEVSLGETVEVCLNTLNIGTPESLVNIFTSFTENAELILNDTECFEIVGVEEGPDQAILVLCDETGKCDTTYLDIDVVDNSTELEIYTGFSPNNDGINDYFRIKNIELYPNNSLVIFNRWGNRVFQRESYRNAAPWNAEYKNTHLPDGSYFYILEVEIDGNMKTFKGYVQVRR